MNTFKRLSFMALTGALVAGILINPVAANSGPAESDQDDWARVKAAGKILVGTSADYAPFEFYDTNYHLDGFDIALFKAIGKTLSVTVEFNDFAFEGLGTALQLKQVDAAIGAISVTPERQKALDFTNLYYIGKDAALVRNSFAGNLSKTTDMAGKKIGVEKGTTYQSWAQQTLVDPGLVTQADLVPYADTDSLVRDLRASKIDIGLLGELPARTFDKRFRDLRIAGTNFNAQNMGIAVRNGSTLTEQFNGALLKLQSNGTFATLIKQYLQVDASEVTPTDSASQVVNDPATTVPTQTAQACLTGMSFVGDVNLDDKNMAAPPILKPGQQFIKGWKLKNNGTCDWDATFKLAYSYGNRPEARMGGSEVAIGKAVKVGETIEISANLVAPTAYGTFQGFWNMRDANNQNFGEVVWVGIQVPDPNPPPAPTAPPPPPRPVAPQPPAPVNPNLRADANWLNPGQCTSIRWDVDNVNAVFFIDNGNLQGVAGHDVRTVCPSSTNTYTLRVVRRDNATQDFPITINVNGQSASINFWVDNGNIGVGQCTTLRWDVRNVRAVYLNNNGVAGQSSQQVCPNVTTTYTLHVIRNDNGDEYRQVVVNVGSTPGQPTPIPPPTPQP